MKGHSAGKLFDDPRRRLSLRFQKQSALAQWYRARTADSRLGTRKTMIVALARKLLAEEALSGAAGNPLTLAQEFGPAVGQPLFPGVRHHNKLRSVC